MVENGLVGSVQRVARGSELVAAAAVAATVLYVDSAEDFDDAGGDLEINGARYEYLSSDIDADTITLATGLASAAAVSDGVYPVAGGQIAVDHIAYVSLGEGDAAEVLIPYAERPLWPEGVYDDPVPVALSPDLTSIVNVPGRVPVIDGTTYQTSSEGERIVIRNDGDTGIIESFSGTADEIEPGAYDPSGLLVGSEVRPTVGIRSGTSATQDQIGKVTVFSGNALNDGGGVLVEGRNVGIYPDDDLQVVAGGDISFHVTGTHTATVDGPLVVTGSAHGLDIYSDGQTGAGTVGASLTSQGRLIRTPSTRKVKKDIKPMPREVAAKVLNLEPVTFRLRNDDDTVYPGFIAEQAVDVGAELWVTHDKHGDPNGFRYAEVTAALVALAREDRAEIAELKTTVAALKQQVTALTSTLKLNGKAKP